MRQSEDSWKECDTCGHREFVSHGRHFCDSCGIEIHYNENVRALSIRVFPEVGEDADGLECCSWACVLKALRNLDPEEIRFLIFPYLTSGNQETPGQGWEDFFTAVKEFGR